MTNLVQWLIKPSEHGLARFWGPVGIAVGVTCILNVFSITKEAMSFEPQDWLVTLIGGIVCVMLGGVALSVVISKEVFARLGLTTVFSIFFFGTHIANVYSLGLGLFVMAIALTLIWLGFEWAPKA